MLGNKIDNIHTKTIYPPIKPPTHHCVDFIAEVRIFPIQIRLVWRKEVQVVFSTLFLILPGGSLKKGEPVIRWSKGGPLGNSGRLPYIVLTVGAIFRTSRRLKPGVLI